MTTFVPLTRKNNRCLARVRKDNWALRHPVVLLVLVACLAVVIEAILIWRYLDSWISLPIL